MKRQLLKLLMAAFLLCIPLLKSWAQTEIWTPEDLRNIKNNLSGNYILMQDIDFTGVNGWLPIAAENVPAGTNVDTYNFIGTFDGQGHKLSNITVAATNRSFVSALFIKLGNSSTGAVVKNLILENVNITGGNVVGGLTGTVFSNGSGNSILIENVHVTGKITGYGEAGGITGRSNEANPVLIRNCSVNADITATDFSTTPNQGVGSNTPAKVNVGGIVGSAFNGTNVTIENCFVQGQIIATTAKGNELNPGGLIGHTNAAGAGINLKNLVVVAGLNGGTNAFWGNKVNVVNVISCYARNDVGLTNQVGGVLSSPSDLMKQSFYENLGWNFENVWTIDEGVGFPTYVEPEKPKPEDPDGMSISTYEEFNTLIRANLSGKYYLTQDIVIPEGTEWLPFGKPNDWDNNVNSLVNFTGILDGKGYAVKNLKITTGANFSGLFARIVNGEVKNLLLENVNINGGTPSGALSGILLGGLTTSEEFNEGDPLYIAGEGAEQGQQLKYFDTGVYEIFTRLEANKSYYFCSGKYNSGKIFTINAAGNAFTSETSEYAKVNIPGVYRIRLNYKTSGATIQRVIGVAIRYCQKNEDTQLLYAGQGKWIVKNYNVSLTNQSGVLEDRYKFVITVSGQTALEHYGKIDAYNDRPSIDREGYRDVQFIGQNAGQYVGAFKFPQELCDPNDLNRFYTDIVLYLNADKENYTHDFLNYAPKDINWASAADSCTFVLVNQFLNTTGGWFWSSAKNVANNSSNNYWGQAYPMHTLLFSHERIKDANPTLAATYRNYFDLWVKNNGHNWYGGDKKNGFYGSYTDDMAWIALTLMHMEEVKGITKNGDNGNVLAEQIYGYMTEPVRILEDDEGWGLKWRLPEAGDGDNRNACTNTPAMIVACKLYQKTGTQKYLDDAIKLFDFMTKTGNRVRPNGAVSGTPLTYTQGTWIEACRLLYHITGDTKYRDRATICVQYTMDPTGSCTTTAGILRSEGNSGDQSNFKGGLIPYMVDYANDEDMPANTRQQVKTFLIFNAKTLWLTGLDHSKYPQMFCNFIWNQLYIYNVSVPSTDANYCPGSLGAHNSGAALLEGITRLK